MQVDANSFAHKLPDLLVNISEADLLSFDLELTGIPSRLQDKPAHQHDRSSLEARYAEAKASADRYQILQVGITCARFDHAVNAYVLRPYNINLSPLLDERIDLERDFCFQSGACSFLLKIGFDLAAPFKSGIQYLSRDEANRAQQLAFDRIDKTNPIEDLQLRDSDVESLDFVRRVREAIQQWNPKRSSCLEISSQTGSRILYETRTISRFEKRLVYQLVRAEFPDLVTVGRPNSIQIKQFDSFREAEYTRRQKVRVRELLVRQTGFRWVFEALAQDGSINIADLLQFFRSNTGTGMFADIDQIKRCCEHAMERLKKKKPVLVGHNMFTDIVYIYRTFVGPLPDTLQEFKAEINRLFPRIVDTKYLATYDQGDSKSPTLQEIARTLSSQPLPKISTHTDFTMYEDVEAFHEAGYDSLQTAKIMLQLAAKLGAERSVQIPTSLSSTNVPRRKSRNMVSKPEMRETSHLQLETENVYSILQDHCLNPDVDTESETESSPDPAASSCQRDGEDRAQIAESWANDEFIQDTSSWVPIEQIQRGPMELIPAFDSAFWKEFGNKLRLFGTQEAVLKLADWEPWTPPLSRSESAS